MKHFVWAGTLFFLFSCAKGQFSGETATQDTEDSTPASMESPTEVPTSVEEAPATVDASPAPSTPKKIAPDEEDPDESAYSPIMIGGAFLVCVQSAQVECRLDTATTKNIAPDSRMKLAFFHGTTPTNFRAATLTDFRWRLGPSQPTGALRSVTLKVTSPKGTQWIYHNEFEVEALQIGDGTNALQGCTQDFVQRSKLVGLKYEQTYTLQPGTTSIMVDLVGLCGVARPNDSTLQILDSAGVEVFKKFLPTTQAIVNLSYAVTGLKAGTYTLRVTPGDDIDIDDLFINSLGVSNLVP